MTPEQDERYLPMQRQTGRQPAKAITDAGIMILLYGAGGVPGRGEIPMDLQPQASDDFPGVRGSGKNSTSDRSIEETDSFSVLRWIINDSDPGKEKEANGQLQGGFGYKPEGWGCKNNQYSEPGYIS